jgi:hypothetical protein
LRCRRCNDPSRTPTPTPTSVYRLTHFTRIRYQPITTPTLGWPRHPCGRTSIKERTWCARAIPGADRRDCSGVGPEQILAANGANSSEYPCRQVLTIPAPGTRPARARCKILPDRSPTVRHRGVDLPAYVGLWDSYLRVRRSRGRLLSGPAIVQLVAQRYSVNRACFSPCSNATPAGTNRWPDARTLVYPIG